MEMSRAGKNEHSKRRLADMVTKSRYPSRRPLQPAVRRRITPFPSDYVIPTDFLRHPGAPAGRFPGSFVDVGVNIGQTLLFIKSADASWNYIGFSPR